MNINRKVLIVRHRRSGACGRGDRDRLRLQRRVRGADDRAGRRDGKGRRAEQVGGGTVLEVEKQDGDGDGVYEVEVERPDGSQVEVHVSGQFDSVGTAADDDGGGEDESGEGQEDEGSE